MKIAYIGNYPPRACGISTFTKNLVESIFLNDSETSLKQHARIIAMDDITTSYDYPEEVVYSIATQDQESYRSCSRLLNHLDCEAVVLQHEFGIFGGQDGVFVLALLEELKKPLIVTFHTVLKDPSSRQKFIIQRIGEKADRIVVMSKMAEKFLTEIYSIPEGKILVTGHGVPAIPFQNRNDLRRKLSFENKKILLTFGLLGRGKGIETVIQALPEIIRHHPDVEYLVVGKTHPGVVRQSGEEYRHYLMQLAKEKGVSRHVNFIDAFVSEKKLWEYLQACDLYVVPYLNEAQITSGTLSYAIGAGAATISTPYWHAQELLAEGRGRLFGFRKSEELAQMVNELLSDQEQLSEMRKQALNYGKSLKWPLIGKQYLHALMEIGNTPVQPSVNGQEISNMSYQPLNFDHLLRLTDDTGILQHAKYLVPNRHEGYCLDDNARALITALMARRSSSAKWLDKVSSIYLSYIYHSQCENGLFHNFMSYDRRFLDNHGSEDSFGRAVWSLGYAIAYPVNDSFHNLSKEIFFRAVQHVESLNSIRSISFCILGISYYLHRFPSDENMLGLLHRLRQKLCDFSKIASEEGWQWFEKYLTYCNAIIPLSLFASLRLIPDKEVEHIAVGTTTFLEKITMDKGYCRPVGCNGFYKKDETCSRFDQQPVEILANVQLFLEAYRVMKKKKYLKLARISFEWFYGKNELHLPLYDPETGGCCDGLTATGANLNQGAESTLSYLMSRMLIEEVTKLEKRQTARGKRKAYAFQQEKEMDSEEKPVGASKS